MEDSKRLNLKLIIAVVLCILICLPLGIWLGVKFVAPENKTENEIKEEVEEEKLDDIYGYAIMSYLPGDGSFREYYRIVELHKESKDKVLASYDVNKNNSFDKPTNIRGMKMINNKLYYQLYYGSTSSGILTYNNIMYIDLNSAKKKPVELLNWKQDSNNYGKTLRDFKISDDYVYFSTMNNDFYKYDIKTKEITVINESDFQAIQEQQEFNNEMVGQDKLYINGKELFLDHDKFELVYDGEVIHKSNDGVGSVYLLYSFEGDIVIREYSDCFAQGCSISKYYKYNESNKTMEEIDFTKNQLFDKSILYK